MSDHISVLMNEVIEGLDISPNDIIVDATVNGGGHASEITKRLSSKGIFIGLDLDSKALKVSEERLQEVECKVSLVNQSFADLDIVLKDLKLDGFSISNKDEKLVGFKSFEIDFSLLKSIHEYHISFKKVNLIKPYVNIVQDENGNINLASIMKQQEVKPEEKSTDGKSSIPAFKITKIQIITM